MIGKDRERERERERERGRERKLRVRVASTFYTFSNCVRMASAKWGAYTGKHDMSV